VNQSGRFVEQRAPGVALHVSYCAIFCQSKIEYESLASLAASNGILGNDTATGPVFAIRPLNTDYGKLRILKIRVADPTRPERGDADFRLDDYEDFKAAYLSQPHFTLIERPGFEMIELYQPSMPVRAYFSNPPVEKHANLPAALAEAERRWLSKDGEVTHSDVPEMA
jgi:hypothetical protein